MKIIILTFVSLFMVSCASLKPREDSDMSVPKSLPQDIQDRFSVQTNKIPKKKPVLEKTSVNKLKSKKKNAKPNLEQIPTEEVISYFPVPFSPGENLNYSVSYLGVHAGNLQIRVMPVKFINDKEVLHFKANVYSAAFFANMFKVNLLIESFVNRQSFFSYRFQTTGEEGPTNKQNVELYDPDKMTVYEWKKEEKNGQSSESKKTFNSLVPNAQDILSSLYYIRSIDFSKNKEKSFSVVSGEKIKQVNLKVTAEDSIKYKSKSIKVWVIQVNVSEVKNAQTIWLSQENDAKILKIKADIKWGSFTVTLEE